jgi:hypothetical protein
MFTFTESDFLPIERFAYRWRFTNPKYVQLTPTELNQLHPLSLTASNSVDTEIRSLLDKRKLPVTTDVFGRMVKYDTSGDPLDTKEWLERTLRNLHGLVIVSWDADNAVVTSLQLFLKYWDDFCYPGSDDTTIVPLDLSWIIQYWHEEVICFAARNAKTEGTVAGSGVAPDCQSL